MLALVCGVRLDVVTRLGELELFAGVSGRSRLSPAICGEYARKLCGGQVLSLVTGLPPLVCRSIARASKLRILPSGDAYITDLVLDIAATASYTSVRPSKTAQRHPSARRRGSLPTAGCHSLRPARPSAGLQPRTLTKITLHGRRVMNCLLYTSPSPRDRTRSR